jgi:TonB family protein
MRAKRLLLVAIVTLLCGSLTPLGAPYSARADDTAQTSLESGTFANPIERKIPRFPQREADAGIEGWVVVSYVINPDGTVGEAIIEDSSGRHRFERASIGAIEDWTYEPATMNGSPVEQCHTQVLMTFELDTSKANRGAKKRFKNQYKKANQLLEKGQLKEARSKIDEIEEKFVTNLYESSRLWILRSMLQEKEGDDLGQLKSLRRGVSGGGEYVEPNVYLTVLMKIFNLQMQFQHYAEALETLETLEGLDLGDDMAAKLAQFKNQIEGLRTTDQTVAVEGEIGEAREEHQGAGMWWHMLLRRTAGIETVSGSLERVELRCDWRRVKAKPEKGKAWRIPSEWGDCSIYVFGEPGSTFRLLEYASTAS